MIDQALLAMRPTSRMFARPVPRRVRIAPVFFALTIGLVPNPALYGDQVVLESAASKGGISIDQSFYQFITDDLIAPQNLLRLGATGGAQFRNAFVHFNDTFGSQTIVEFEDILRAWDFGSTLRTGIPGDR